MPCISESTCYRHNPGLRWAMTPLSAPPSKDLLSVLTSQQQPQLWRTSPLADEISRQPVLAWRARLSQKALCLPTSCNVKALPSEQVKIYSQAGLTLTYHQTKLFAGGMELVFTEGENEFHWESFKVISAIKLWLHVS